MCVWVFDCVCVCVGGKAVQDNKRQARITTPSLMSSWLTRRWGIFPIQDKVEVTLALGTTTSWRFNATIGLNMSMNGALRNAETIGRVSHGNFAPIRSTTLHHGHRGSDEAHAFVFVTTSAAAATAGGSGGAWGSARHDVRVLVARMQIVLLGRRA